MILAALVAAAGCGGGTATMDGGTAGTGGRGGTSAAGGRGGASSGGGATGAAGRGGTTGAGGSGAAGTGGTSGAAGAGGTTGTAGAGGTAGAAGRGGAGGASGAGGTAGGGGGGGASGVTGTGGSGGRGGAGGSAGAGGAAGRGGTGGAAGSAGGGGGAAGIAGGGGGGAGGDTACTTTSGCTSAQYCDISNNRCASNAGACKARPQGCTADVDRVCGCDGVVYSNSCVAAAVGTDISDLGGCTPPTGTFPCGPRFCMHGTQYCEGKTGGAATNPGDYACHTLPAACGGTPTCACITGAMCGNCTMSNNGDIMTSCLFP